MTNSSARTHTGYFNALTSVYFKTAQDGSKVFYPWGATGRGYAIPSEQDYERLHRQIKIYQIASLVAIIGAVVAEAYLGAVIIAALVIAFYMAWTPFLLRGLQPSEERLSLRESMATQARAHGAVGLWVLETIALALVAIGVLVLMIEPEKWLIGLASIVFFGLCAAVFALMLVLRRRAASQTTVNTP